MKRIFKRIWVTVFLFFCMVGFVVVLIPAVFIWILNGKNLMDAYADGCFDEANKIYPLFD